MTNRNTETGKQISRLRSAAGLTQRDLAGKLYVVQQAVNKWETGANLPQCDKLMDIAEALGVSVLELFAADDLTELFPQPEGAESIPLKEQIRHGYADIDYTHEYIKAIDALRSCCGRDNSFRNRTALAYALKDFSSSDFSKKERLQLTELDIDILKIGLKNIRDNEEAVNNMLLGFWRFRYPETYRMKVTPEAAMMRADEESESRHNNSDNQRLFEKDCGAAYTQGIRQNKGGFMSEKIGINEKTAEAGVFITGKPGTGKTSLLAHIADKVIGNTDHTVVVVDPYGNLADSIIGYISEKDAARTTVMDFTAADYVVPCNPLDIRHSGLTPEEAAQRILDVGSALWSTSWGPRMQEPLKMALMAIAGHNSGLPSGSPADGLSFIGIFLNGTPEGRMEYISTVEDEETKKILEDYFCEKYDKLAPDKREQIIMPILSKSYRFEEMPMLETFSAPHTEIDFAEIIESGKILLIKTGILRHGKEISDFLGSLIINSNIKTAADLAGSQKTCLFVDGFDKYSGIAWNNVIPQLRSELNISPVLSTQSVSAALTLLPQQTPKAILGNFGTLIAFSSDNDDAYYLTEAEFARGEADPEELKHLPPFISCVKSTGDGVSAAGVYTAPDPVKIIDENRERVMSYRKNYSIKKDDATKNAMGYIDRINDYGILRKKRKNCLDQSVVQLH